MNFCYSLRRQFLRISPPTQESENTALSKEQWRNRKKVLGNVRLGVRASKNAHKHYHRSAKIHAKTANQCLDLLHKTTAEISQKYTLASKI